MSVVADLQSLLGDGTLQALLSGGILPAGALAGLQPVTIPELAISNVRNAARYCIINGVYAGFLFCFFVVFILKVWPRSGPTALFILQTTAFIFTLTFISLGVANSWFGLILYLDPSTYKPVTTDFAQLQQSHDFKILIGMTSAQQMLGILSTLLADSTLIIKLLCFYPASIFPTWRRVLVVAPLVLIGLARLGTAAAQTAFMSLSFKATDFSALERRLQGLANVAFTDGMLQLCFCLYVSAMLLYKTLTFARKSSANRSHGSQLRRRMRLLIESACMTFIPPLLVQIPTVILVRRRPGSYAQTYLLLSNAVLSVVFSVLATSWSTIRGVEVRVTQNSKGEEVERRMFTGDVMRPGGVAGGAAAAVGGLVGKRRGGSSSDDEGDVATRHRTWWERIYGSADDMELLQTKAEVDAEAEKALPLPGTASRRRMMLGARTES